MSTGSIPALPGLSRSPLATALGRGAAFFVLWMLLIQSGKPSDLAMGMLASVSATWVSMRLLPPSSGGLHFGKLLALLPHFVWESLLAGMDVARRALSPRMPMSPGFVTCPLDLPPGFARNTFATITSNLPGTVATGEAAGELVYHCLDVTAPVVEQLLQEERRLASALLADPGHD